jgi:hypothetical protein
MNRGTWMLPDRYHRRISVGLVGVMAVIAGCNSAAPPPEQSDDNVLLNEALSFEGKITGQVFDTQTTRGSLESAEAAQSAPLGFNTQSTLVRFQDVAGNPLRNPDGNPIPPVPLNDDGTFSAEDLPVGTDVIVCVDIESDEDCDETSCVNIPGDETGRSGTLDDARVDPLTTLVLAKLKALMQARGIAPRDLPISPVAVVARIVEAYTHLYEESGIDQTLTLAELIEQNPEAFGELFDELIPAGAQAGMRIVEGNLDLARADDADARAKAAAEVFLRAGFPIADHPDGLDLSFLGALDGVESASADELFGFGPDLDEFEEAADLPDDFFDAFEVIEPAAAGDPTIIYFDPTTEPDRNFANADGEEDNEDPEALGPQLPVIGDRILLKMADLDLRGGRITLRALHAALTDLETGLGARLTYMIDDPNFAGPPLTVFESADGKGQAIDLERLFFRFFQDGLNVQGEEDLDQIDRQFQTALNDLLGDTQAPSFDRIFGQVVDERIAGVSDLAQRLRNARAHLPFNRSGDEGFFVIADGDAFDPQASARPVTVDAEVDPNGIITRVTYNPAGTGEFYLGFTERTEENGAVEFIIRETGRRLHNPRGPVRLRMSDSNLFTAINGVPFFEFVSESGRFYPGIDVPVNRVDFFGPPPGFDEFDNDPPPFDDPFDPDTPDLPFEDPFNPDAPFDDDPFGDPFDPDAPDDFSFDPDAFEPAEFEDDFDSNRIFVLATGFGPRAEPVRVSFDPNLGVATFDPNGRNLLMFGPNTEATGEFILFNEQTGREAGMEDPAGFFGAPPELPDDFENFFNEFEDDPNFDPFAEFDGLDEFVNDFLGDLPPDGDFPDGFPEDPPFDDPFFEDPGFDDFPPDGEFPNDPFDPFGDPPPFPGEDPNDPNFIPPAEFVDAAGRILIDARDVIGLEVRLESFTRVFGIEAPNGRYDADADPFYDDLNGNNVHDPDEPTAPYRPVLFDPRDWRSTDIPAYYRRADNGEPVSFDDVDFESDTPRTLAGVNLVARKFKPRLNAFRFGRPNTAMNLLTAFLPPEFFDGTRQLTADTSVDIFTAVALVNLVMDQVFNIESEVDIDGLGPLPRERILLNAHLFIVPLDDPFVVLIRAIADRAQVNNPPAAD